MTTELQRVIGENEARVNITFGGQSSDLPDPAPRDASDDDVRRWATEAVRSGTIPGLPQDATADFSNYVVDRHPPHEARPYHQIMLRPKTPFGKLDDKQKADEEATLSEAVYSASCAVFERLEDGGHLHGNGHHMAQELARNAVELLKKTWL